MANADEARLRTSLHEAVKRRLDPVLAWGPSAPHSNAEGGDSESGDSDSRRMNRDEAASWLAEFLIASSGGDVQSAIDAVERVGPMGHVDPWATQIPVPPMPSDVHLASETSDPHSTIAEPPMHDAPPGESSVGKGHPRFQAVEPIAEGGLGRVSLAIDSELDREVALKELLGHHADDESKRRRFVREAELTGKLEHPGIVPIYGLGQYADGRPYYAMRFVRGRSLRAELEAFHKTKKNAGSERRLGQRALLEKVRDVCDAVHYAHQKHVLHRDLKPANIMLGEFGETLVVDWGLAKVIDPNAAEMAGVPVDTVVEEGAQDMTQQGTVVGTPYYMSPEQAHGWNDAVGVPSDVYSLGATLYEVLTGQPPLSDKSDQPVLARARMSLLTPVRQLDPSAPKPLAAICHKAMAHDRSMRYASAAELGQDLERYLADEPVRAYREPLLQRVGRWSRRNRSLTQAIGAALLLLTVVSAVYVVLIKRAESLAQWNREIAVALQKPESITLASTGFHDLLGVTDNIAALSPADARLRQEELLEAAKTNFVSALSVDNLDAESQADLSSQLDEFRSLATSEGLPNADSLIAELNQALEDRRVSENIVGGFTLPGNAQQALTQFEDSPVMVDASGLLVSQLESGGYDDPYVALKDTSPPGGRRISATFGAGWWEQRAIGLRIGSGPEPYEFLLTSPLVDPRDRTPRDLQRLPTMREQIDALTGAENEPPPLELYLFRGRTLLAEKRVNASPGPIKLEAKQEGGLVSIDVDGRESLAFEDVFSQAAAGESELAVYWPRGATLSHLMVAHTLPPKQPSDIELADQLFAEEQWADAEQAYAKIAESGASVAEASYKRASCLERLRRQQDALAILNQLMNKQSAEKNPDEADKYRLLASVRVALAHAQDMNYSQAFDILIPDDASLDPLYKKYGKLIRAADQRALLLNLNRPVHMAGSALGTQNDERELMLAIELQKLWGDPPAEIRESQLKLAEFCHVNISRDPNGDARYRQAVELYNELLANTENVPDLERCVWAGGLVNIYLQEGKLDLADELVTRELQETDGQITQGRLPMLIDRARVRHAQGRPDDAQRDLEEYLEEVDPKRAHYAHYSAASMLLGVIHRRAGREEQAREVWLECLRKDWPTRIPGNSDLVRTAGYRGTLTSSVFDYKYAMLSWTDTISDQDVREIITTYVGGIGVGSVAVVSAVKRIVGVDLAKQIITALHAEEDTRRMLEDGYLHVLPPDEGAKTLAARAFFHAIELSTFAGEVLPAEFKPFALQKFDQLITLYRADHVSNEDMKALLDLWNGSKKASNWTRVRNKEEFPADLKAASALVFGRAAQQKNGSARARTFYKYVLAEPQTPVFMQEMAKQYLAEMDQGEKKPG